MNYQHCRNNNHIIDFFDIPSYCEYVQFLRDWKINFRLYIPSSGWVGDNCISIIIEL